MAWHGNVPHGLGNVHLLYTLTLPTHECLNGPAYLAGSGIQQCAWAISVPLHECLDCIDAPDTLSSIRRAQREKVLLQGDGEIADDGTYKGMTGYVDYRKGFRREHNVGSEKGTGSHGPLRASMYARVSTRFDYQPDICKDYKETGFCSYGDACKFLHDRGDYKSGWELERVRRS